jgi:hypothetical protein
MSFVPCWADRRQELERQTSCEQKAILWIAYTTLKRRLTVGVTGGGVRVDSAWKQR